MKKPYRKIYAGRMLFFLILALVIPLASYGVEPTCPQKTFCITPPTGITDLNELLKKILNFLITVATPIAVIMIVYGGISFIFAAGDPEKITRARAVLLWTAIGFGIILVAKGIVAVITKFLQ